MIWYITFNVQLWQKLSYFRSEIKTNYWNLGIFSEELKYIISQVFNPSRTGFKFNRDLAFSKTQPLNDSAKRLFTKKNLQ